MKRLLFLAALSTLCAYAEDSTGTVYLDLNIGEEHEFKTFTQKINNLSVVDDVETEDYIYHPMKYIKEEARELFFENRKENSK